ncbi:FecR family protein [Novispirillum itersonii]|uniref:Transmembrane sensor n=1 Tax=Novispirillum itersonii TaxID=189 RepID=A0A7W9ZGH3_NOVIT|nr:FecR domain-containing protein [Novispirillum itersonii]MBB6211076.1 transmembrane sensor [Novispirillum itersonii]
MSDRSQLSSPRKAVLASSPREAALAWFVRLHSGDASRDDHAAFALWADAAPEHRQEYARLDQVWEDLEHLPDPRPAQRRRRLHRRALAGAALCTLALGIAAGPLTGPFGPLPLGDGVGYAAATGQIRSVPLPDGSRLVLEAGSRAVVTYSPDRRHVELREGRVQAVVATDPARPFEVTSAGLTARALGTAYTVEQRQDATIVAVQESTVEVRRDGQPPQRLTAGQRLTASAAGMTVDRASAADTAWQNGHMVFEDVALADVIAGLNRWRPGTVLLLGPDLAARRVSGVFDTASPDAILAALTATLGLRQTRLPGGVVLLRQG